MGNIIKNQSFSTQIKLREATIEDVELLYEKAYSNAAFMRLFKLNACSDKQQMIEQYSEREKTKFCRRSYKEFLIYHQCYGVIGLAALADHNTFHNSAEILIGLFDKKHQNSMFGLLATLLLMDKAFNKYGLNRLNSYVYGHNEYARQCTEKLGFSFEGLRKDFIYSTATQSYIDVYCFGLREVDFRANKPLSKYSIRLLGKDIGIKKTTAKIFKHKHYILAATAISSKLAFAPAYGKTSSASTDTSAVISPSDGKSAAANNSGGKTSSGSTGSITVHQITIGGSDRLSCTDSIHKQDNSFDPLDELLYNQSYYQKANQDLQEQFAQNLQSYRNHWTNSGLAEGRVASAVFDVKYYLEKNPDLQTTYGSDYTQAAQHWITTGIYEGRIASPGFDVQYYLSANPDLYAAYGSDFKSATLHWIRHGIQEDRQFSSNLNVGYYLQKNSDLKAQYLGNNKGATYHWLLYGQYEGRNSAGSYNFAKNELSCDQIGSLPAVTSNSSSSTLSNSVSSTQSNFNRLSCTNNVKGEGASFEITDQLLFNDTFYKRLNPGLKNQFGDDYWAYRTHWQNTGLAEGRVASPVFDVRYYLEKNPDLEEKFGNDFVAAAKHWIQYGIYEGRTASSAFDVQYYLSANYDVYEIYGSDFKKATLHWLNHGIKEARQFSSDLNVVFYLQNNDDLASFYGTDYAGAVTHWLSEGQYTTRVASDNYNYATQSISCDKIGSIVNLFEDGDYIKYTVQVYLENLSGIGSASVSGTGKVSFSDSHFTTPYANQVLKMRNEVTLDGSSGYSNNYVFFDKNSNLVNYKTQSYECVNQTDCDKGIVFFPAQMNVGDTWSTKVTTGLLDQAYLATETYRVLAQENISTGAGNYNTYKIAYTAYAVPVCGIYGCTGNSESATLTGNTWYKPELGIVKQTLNTTLYTSGGNFLFKMSMLLSSTNIQ